MLNGEGNVSPSFKVKKRSAFNISTVTALKWGLL